MSLRDRLDEQWQRALDDSPEPARALEALMRALGASNLAAASLRPGDTMPDFELPNVEGRLVAARDCLARGPLVISFFRGGWCPYCSLELAALQEALAEIERQGASVRAITPDTGAAFAEVKRRLGLSFEVLSDVDNGAGLLFGVIFRLPEAVREIYLRLGVDLGARHGNRDTLWLLPMPATYIVDRGGVIRHAMVELDYRRRMEPSEIVGVLRALAAEAGSGDGQLGGEIARPRQLDEGVERR
ncbi:MAG: peroxiredoxin-like family protein [Stellaceae bacterium]